MSGITIPSSPNDRQSIKLAMGEISNSYARMEAEREFVREALKDLEDNVDIKAKYLRKMSRIFHKQNLVELTAEMDDLEGLYEAIK